MRSRALSAFRSSPSFKSGVMLASFGYVLGFIAAAYVVGFLAERGWDSSIPKMFAAMLLGAAVLYVPGLIWLSAWIGAGQGHPVRPAALHRG